MYQLASAPERQYRGQYTSRIALLIVMKCFVGARWCIGVARTKHQFGKMFPELHRVPIILVLKIAHTILLPFPGVILWTSAGHMIARCWGFAHAGMIEFRRLLGRANCWALGRLALIA